MNILLIGGDSYIGGNFYRNSQFNESIKVISRNPTSIIDELVIPDLYNIPDDLFNSIDLVISFIGVAHRKEQSNHDLYFSVNRDLVYTIAIQAKKNDVKNFIQMSSISVYGTNNVINESTVETPDTIYGESKLEADHLLLDLQNQNFSVTLLRPPMIYGSHAPGNWNKLLKLVDRSLILPFKNIKNERTFLYIHNFILSLDWIIQYRKTGVIIITDSFNLSTEEIIKLMINSLNKFRILIDYRFVYLSKIILPNQYNKLFGDLVIKSNIQFKSLKKEQVFSDLLEKGMEYE